MCYAPSYHTLDQVPLYVYTIYPVCWCIIDVASLDHNFIVYASVHCICNMNTSVSLPNIRNLIVVVPSMFVQIRLGFNKCVSQKVKVKMEIWTEFLVHQKEFS